MRILCATDLSSRSDRAMRRAGRLAAAHRATLTLLSVVDDDQPAALVESERRQVATLLAELAAGMAELKPLSPRIVVEPGDAFDAIIRFAESDGSDLVVMGEHRRRLLRDIVVGTTVERVMRLGRRPVLMATAPAERPYARVLAAIDLAEQGAPALKAARRLGLLEGASLTLFHAFTPLAAGALVVGDAGRREIGRHVAAEAERARRGLAQLAEAEGLDGCDILVQEGPVGEAFTTAVAATLPDLVVMGTRAHGALGRLMLGSLAEQALASLTCDVLVVPPGL